MPVSVQDFDLIVIGAGPAGSAAALSALRADASARVLLLDRAPLGRDKVCGDGIAPHAVVALEELGVSAVRDAEVVPAVRLSAPGGRSSGAVTRSPGYVVPRREFDERLARAAIAAGARFRQHRVMTVWQSERSVTIDGQYRAPVLVAADGSNSIVRRLVGEPSNQGSALAVAVRGYVPTPPQTARELVIRWDGQRAGGLCYAWAFPTSDGTTNVGYGMSSAAVTGGRAQLLDRLRTLLPEYDLDDVRLVGHTLPLTISRPRAAVGRVLLTGDAASLINPMTGEGIYSAIVSGALAGRLAVTRPNTAGRLYRAGLARRFGGQHRQLKALYPHINSRFVLDTIIRACERDRREFDRLLEVGLGDSRFTLRDIARFARAVRR